MGKIGGRHDGPVHLMRTQDTTKKGVINSEVNRTDARDDSMVGNAWNPNAKLLRTEKAPQKELTIGVLGVHSELLTHWALNGSCVEDQPDKLVLAESVRDSVVGVRRRPLRSVSPRMEGRRLGSHPKSLERFECDRPSQGQRPLGLATEASPCPVSLPRGSGFPKMAGLNETAGWETVWWIPPEEFEFS